MPSKKSSTSCHCRETCGEQCCSMHAAGVTRSQEEALKKRDKIQELLLRLTMELGGRFFLNFALTTPTLP